jgi:hypothetical protein
MGDTRSLSKLQEQLGLEGRSKAQLGQWSTKHDWVEPVQRVDRST